SPRPQHSQGLLSSKWSLSKTQVRHAKRPGSPVDPGRSIDDASPRADALPLTGGVLTLGLARAEQDVQLESLAEPRQTEEDQRDDLADQHRVSGGHMPALGEDDERDAAEDQQRAEEVEPPPEPRREHGAPGRPVL